MHLELLEVTDSGLAYMVIGGFVVAFSMVSLLVKEKLYINEVVLGTACGVIFGPYCANVFNPRSWGGDTNVITLEVMRITLAAGLFAIGVELPQSYLADHAKGLLVMVVPTMAFGWLIGAAVIYAIFPPLNFISSLVIAACLTPTDPIISAAIVGGKFATKHVPLNLRRILSAESAANDGLAYPFLSISVYLTTEASRRVAIGEWFLVGWLYQVILGVIIGAVLGIAFSHLMKFSHRKGYIDRESYVAQYLALALFTIGITRTLGSDDLLAAFAAGSAISWDGYFNTQTEDEVFSSVIDLLLNCGCFVYIGAWMPFNMFNAPELGITPGRLVGLFMAILVLRRIPPLLLLYKWVPEIRTWREAVFSGHFGPMGVGAIFISTLAVTELPTPHYPPQNQAELLAATLQTIVAFVVLGSIIIHGLSIPFFSFGRNVRARTLSITRTWTATARPGGQHTPDWLLWARGASATSTRPGTPLGDVERGLGGDRKVDTVGLTEPPVTVAREAEGRNAGGKDAHVPELGPAAMISDATAGPASLEVGTHHDKPAPSSPSPSTKSLQANAEAEEIPMRDMNTGDDSALARAHAHADSPRDVNMKPDAAAKNDARASPTSALPASASQPLEARIPNDGGELQGVVAGASPGTSSGARELAPSRVPLPSPSFKAARFPAAPRAGADGVGKGADPAGEGEGGALGGESRVPSRAMTPVHKTVRFPEGLGDDEDNDKASGAPVSHGGPKSTGTACDTVGRAGDDGEGTAAAALGEAAHFPASQ